MEIMSKHEERSLAGTVVAITGGARGIGRATAEAFVRKGARVAIGDLDAALASRTASEIGSGTVAFPLDVTKRASFADFIHHVEAALGPIDVLVNNAGIMPVGPFESESDAIATRMVDINVHGVIFGMKLVIPAMKARRRGHIVNIASGAGKTGVPGVATYCATKFAVVGVSEAVRLELRGTGVEISCVRPAIVNTELTTGVPSARFVKNLEPEDVADAIVDVVLRPRFEVPVPGYLGFIEKTMSLLPIRVRDRVMSLLRADEVMIQADSSARAAYEQRAASSRASSPGADEAPR